MEPDPGISDKKLEANRQNSLKSTGPTSIEGKARSAMNALKHGLTAEQIVLPNEDPEAYDALRQKWLDDYPDADAGQLALIEIAVRNIWMLDRAARHKRAMSAKHMRHAADAFDCEEQIRAEEIGRRLVNDPLNRCANAPKDPRTLDTLDDWFKNDDPPVLRAQLFQSLKGVDWLLRQWSELYGLIDRTGFWHYNDKFRALRMMGKRPQDVLDDFEIAMIFGVCHEAHPEPWTLWNECHQARLGAEGKPMWEKRVDCLKGFKITHPEGAAGELKGIVARETLKLNARRAELEPIHACDRAEAADRAAFDGTPAGALVHRYEAACERTVQRSFAELMKVRKQSGRDGGERVVAAARPAPSSPKQPDAVSKPAAKEMRSEPAEPARNEAKGDARYRPPGPIIQKVWDVDTGCP